MISKGCLVRTGVASHGVQPYANLPIGTVCLAISDPYESVSFPTRSVIDILFEGKSLTINIHNVVEVQ